MVLEQLIVICYQQTDQHVFAKDIDYWLTWTNLTWTKTELFINNRQHVENHGDIRQKVRYVDMNGNSQPNNTCKIC